LKKSVRIGLYLLKVNPSEIPEKLLESVADYLVNMCMELKEYEWAIAALEQIITGVNKGGFPATTREKYALMLTEQYTFLSKFDESVKTAIEMGKEFKKISLKFKLLEILGKRFLERAKDEIYYKQNVNEAHKIRLKTKKQDALVVEYVHKIELELQKRGNLDMIHMIDELCTDIGYFQSEHQKSPLYVSGLKSERIWYKDTFEKEEDFEALDKFRENWVDVRKQVLNVLMETPETSYNNTHKEYDVFNKENQLIIIAPGFEMRSMEFCSKMVDVCMGLQNIRRVQESVLGSIFISIMEPGAVIAAHTAKSNFNLRVYLPLVAPEFDPATMGQGLPKAGIAVAEKTVLVLEQGKLAIIDPSYSHQLWNRAEEPVISLVFEFEHPDIGPKTRNALQTLYDNMDLEESLLEETFEFKEPVIKPEQKDDKNNSTNTTETGKKSVEPTTNTLTIDLAPKDEPSVNYLTKLVETDEEKEAYKKQQAEMEEIEYDEDIDDLKASGLRVIEYDDDSLIVTYPIKKKD